MVLSRYRCWKSAPPGLTDKKQNLLENNGIPLTRLGIMSPPWSPLNAEGAVFVQAQVQLDFSLPGIILSGSNECVSENEIVISSINWLQDSEVTRVS